MPIPKIKDSLPIPYQGKLVVNATNAGIARGTWPDLVAVGHNVYRRAEELHAYGSFCGYEYVADGLPTLRLLDL